MKSKSRIASNAVIRYVLLAWLTINSITIGAEPIQQQESDRAPLEFREGNQLLNLSKQLQYSNPDSSILTAKRALKLFETSRNISSGLLRAKSRMANGYYMKGNMDTALELFSEVLPLIDSLRIPNQKLRAQTLMSIGRVYQKIDIQNIALEYLTESQKLWEVIGDKEREATGLMNLAYSYYLDLQYDKAIAVSYDALELLNQIQASPNHSFGYSQLADIYITTGELDSAKVLVDLALPLTIEFDNFWEFAGNYYLRARIALEEGNFDLAEKHVLYSLQVAKAHNIKVDLDTRYKLLADVYENKNQNRLALKYLNLSLNHEDSLNILMASQRLGALNVYRKQKEGALVNLELKNDLLVAKSKQERLTFFNSLTIIGLLAVISILVVFYQVNRKLTIKNKKIQKQSEELTDLNLTKNKLFAVISHDYKSPLSRINSFLYLMKEKSLTREQFDQYVDQLHDQTLRASMLTENVLKWAQSQLDGIRLDGKYLKVKSLVEESIGLAKPSYLKKEITFNSDIKDNFIVYVDPAMMQLVLNNIVTNAIKFTHNLGRVNITAQSQEDNVVICIADNGVGMSADLVGQLFESNLSASQGTENELGSGLGLLLSKDLVTVNGGKIWAESEEGQGSTFYISLPQFDSKDVDKIEDSVKMLLV